MKLTIELCKVIVSYDEEEGCKCQTSSLYSEELSDEELEDIESAMTIIADLYMLAMIRNREKGGLN